MKKLMLTFMMVFSLALVSNAQEGGYDPNAVSNRDWNLTIGMGSHMAGNMKFGDPGSENDADYIEYGASDTIKLTGQIFFNKYVGIEFGWQSINASFKDIDEGNEEMYINEAEVTSLSSAILLRLPATSFWDVYMGLGFGYFTGSITETMAGVDNSVFYANNTTYESKAITAFAEFGMRFYVDNFTAGFGIQYTGFGFASLSQMEFGDYSSGGNTGLDNKLEFGGLTLDVNVGIAF